MTKKVLCIGDSLTYGYDVPYGCGWVEKLQKALPQATFVNAGVNGDTLQGIINRYKDIYRHQKFDLVIFMGGSNDILMGRNSDYCFKKYAEVGELMVVNSQLIVAIPMAMEDSIDELTPIVEAYRRRLLQWAKERELSVIDFFSSIQQFSVAGEIVFAGDVHPNEKGYDIMFQTALAVLREQGIG